MWPNSYLEARDRFRQYTAKDYHQQYDKKFGSFTLDKNRDTSIDFLFLHHRQSTRLQIIISGTHGVEGYAGSAIQFRTLDNIIGQKDQHTHHSLSPVSFLMIHALNPYGYRYNRRCTKNNVDLNRNYTRHPIQTLDYPQQIYRLVTTYLYSFGFVYLFFQNLWRFGYTRAREYIVSGQYQYPQGLFYGGHSREYNITVLEQILSYIDYSRFDTVYIFDIHTGLGPYGQLSVMVTQDSTYQKLRSFYYNRTTKLVDLSTDNMYRHSKGAVIDGIMEYLKPHKNLTVYPIILEYGTYSNLQIFAGLLLENYYYSIRTKIFSYWVDAAKKLKSLFYVPKPDWQDLVLANYQDFTRDL